MTKKRRSVSLRENPWLLILAGAVVVLGFVAVLYRPIRDRFGTSLPPAVPYVPTASGTQDGTVVPSDGGVIVTFEPGVSQSENYVLDTSPQKPPTNTGSKDPLASEGGLPASVNLAVPFTPQAPYANWEMPYQEACEEASAIMVDAYYSGEKAGLIDPETADRRIKNLVVFETTLLGYFEDTTAEETAEVIRKYYGYDRVAVLPFSSPDDLKKPLALGYPVILPAAGQLLGNPYFSGDGPPYHMIVLKGYTDSGFITNDPGTRRGESFVYSYDTIMNAAHDWTGNKDTVEQGSRKMIVVFPN